MMAQAGSSQAIARPVLAAAAHWHVELKSGGADLAALQAWLESSAEHARAWALLQQMDGQLAGIPSALAMPALQAASARRRAATKLLAMLVATSGGVWLGKTGLQSHAWQAWSAQLRTAPGQRRRVQLADGGTLELNTGSAVDIDYDATRRRIRLHEGEILVRTAADRRPFVVETMHGMIRALGTRFLVRSDAASSLVAVYEHAVEVRSSASLASVQRVAAGEQLRFDAATTGALMPAESHQDSWLRGMLVAQDWTLQRLVAELARYRRGHLGCDPAVAQRPVSGTYRVDDTDAALASLCASHQLQVTYLTRYWASVAARKK